MRLSNEQHAHLFEYIRHCADALRMRDVEIVLQPNRPDGGTVAQSLDTYGQPTLLLWVDPAIAMDRRLLRETVLHELLHWHFNPMRNLFFRVNDGEPEGDEVNAVFYRIFKERWEFCIDTMARILAEAIPLIDPFPENA